MKINFKDGTVIEVENCEGKSKQEILDEAKIIYDEFKDSQKQEVKDSIDDNFKNKINNQLKQIYPSLTLDRTLPGEEDDACWIILDYNFIASDKKELNINAEFCMWITNNKNISVGDYSLDFEEYDKYSEEVYNYFDEKIFNDKLKYILKKITKNFMKQNFKDSQVKDTVITLDQLKEGQSVKLIEDIPYDSIEKEDLEEWSRDYGEDFDKVFIKGEFEGKPYALIPKGAVITLKQLNGPAGGWPCFEINGIEVDFCGELGDYKGILINEFKDECLVNDSEESELATEDDWDNFYEEIAPAELEYEDLDIKITEDRFEDYSTGHNEHSTRDWTVSGTINNWTYTLDFDYDDTVAKFYKKDVKEITKQDLLNLKDNKKFVAFLYDEFQDDAISEAKRNYTNDDVDWDYDYEPSYED